MINVVPPDTERYQNGSQAQINHGTVLMQFWIHLIMG